MRDPHSLDPASEAITVPRVTTGNLTRTVMTPEVVSPDPIRWTLIIDVEFNAPEMTAEAICAKLKPAAAVASNRQKHQGHLGLQEEGARRHRLEKNRGTTTPRSSIWDWLRRR